MDGKKSTLHNPKVVGVRIQQNDQPCRMYENNSIEKRTLLDCTRRNSHQNVDLTAVKLTVLDAKLRADRARMPARMHADRLARPAKVGEVFIDEQLTVVQVKRAGASDEAFDAIDP